ncbi:MAG: hypothetical protein GX142_02720 [Chloroflexi bacterium]|nr:hypothetical protein [Chloroflexota bacterium]
MSFAFVSDDRSWENILYLIYLVIFFSVWWFVVLVFFAGGGAAILQGLNPQQPQIAAVAVALIAFLLWFVVAGFRSLRRSPVVFSEEDAYLVCQMPLDPRKLGLRWMLMPWLKSLVPFAAFAVTLGFSLAEVGMNPGAITINRVLNYSWQGLRALLAIIPIHLAMFTMIWIIGAWRVNARRYNRLLPGPTALFGMSGLFLLVEL